METILEQSVTDWELIICDGYSDDGSWEFFQKFRDDPRVTLFQAPRLGTPGSWNYCLERARGEYCYIATSDDTMSSDCLESLLLPLESNRQISLAICDFDAIDDQGRIIPERHRPLTFIDDWTDRACIRHGAAEYLLHACFGPTWVTITSVLFRRNLLDLAGFFPSQLGPVGDTAWAMRANLATDTAYVPGRLATWRKWGQQASRPIKSRKTYKEMLDCVRSATDENSMRIPNEWRSLPAWKAAVTAVWAREYFHTFNLYRQTVRSDTRSFLGNSISALTTEPAYFLRQLRRGFPPPLPGSFNRIETARKLLGSFQAPWPPTPVVRGWDSGLQVKGEERS